MPISQSKEGDLAVLAVEGRLDQNETGNLEKAVMTLLDAGEKKLLFDFSELNYINSSGLRILVMAFQRLKPAGGALGVCNLKDYILEVFEISGYDKLFSLYPSREKAVEGL